MIRHFFFGPRPTRNRVAGVLSALGCGVCLLASSAYAASDTSDIENLFNHDEQVAPEPTPAAAPAPSDPAAQEAKQATDKRLSDVRNVGDLGKLEDFGDIAVIQKRYLPYTGRFEIFAGPTAVLNDAFFNNFGLNVRLAYYFSERYAVEGVGTYLSINERQVTTDLRDKQQVTTKSFVTPQTYAGLDFKWIPIYGKMTWMNRRITPFDMYFSIGGGLTGTNQNTSQATLHLGTGQTFAYTKGIAWRWDFSWDMFNATSSVNTSAAPSFYNNLILTFGMSFFFPEASYR